MNINTNSNMPRNDNNLDTLPKIQKNLMQTIKKNYKNASDCIIRYIVHNHCQAIINHY